MGYFQVADGQVKIFILNKGFISVIGPMVYNEKMCQKLLSGQTDMLQEFKEVVVEFCFTIFFPINAQAFS